MRRLSTDMANPDYIINKQLVSTTQSIPVCTLSIDELTAPGIMAFQRLIEHWQQKHGTVLRIQNHVTYRLEESVLAYYAPELNRAKWWSILMTNSKIIKLFQRMIMPRDRITFAKTLGSVRFSGNNDLRDLIKDFPDYLQSFLLFIKNFKEMHEFLAEDNSKDNIPLPNFKPQGSAHLLWKQANPAQALHYFISRGEKLKEFKTIYSLIDDVLLYLTSHRDSYRLVLKFFNMYTPPENVCIAEYRNRDRYATRPARLHEIQAQPQLPAIEEDSSYDQYQEPDQNDQYDQQYAQDYEQPYEQPLQPLQPVHPVR